MENKISAREKHKLKQFLKMLGSIRGRHTELVSVYVPAGYELSAITNHLQEEQGTASNIKSKQTRENVITALERMIRHLQLYEKTPKNGLAAFSGNVSEKEGQQKVEVWSIEPPVPLNQRLYRCDKEFILEPLEAMGEERSVYGLVVIDKREADIALLKGKIIVPLTKSSSNVPGKTRAGGQCINPNTLVLGENGNIFPIKKVHNPSLIKGMKNFKENVTRVVDVWTNKKKLYKVVTKNPRVELEASKDHVFFVYENGNLGEKPLKNVKEGDLLLLAEKINVKGKEYEFLPLYYNSYYINQKGRKEIKKKREFMGMHQKELAEEAKLTQTAISTIELGKRDVRRETLIKILDILGIDFIKFIVENCRSNDKVQLPTTITTELAEFIGYVTGDGHIEKERITLFEQLKEVAEHYQKLAKKWKANTSFKFRNDKNYHQVRIYGDALSKLLRKEFTETIGSTATIPEKILQSSNKILSAYLKGLFDAEGYVSSRLGMGINNEFLAKQIQFTLLRFGIISSLCTYDNRKNPYSNNVRYTIQISEKESLKKFQDEIGFTSKEKTKKLSNLISKKSEVSRVRQILVDGREIRKIVEAHGYNLELFPKVTNFFRGERMMSKKIYQDSILNYVKDENLKKELEQYMFREFLPVKVASIEETGISNTIDISTTTQNFLAQGILVHNSAHRFERLREGAAKEFYRRVAEQMKANFLSQKHIKGIIIGGPGHTKQEFLDQGQLTDQLKQKIIAMKDISYTGEFGLQELLEKSEDILAEEEVIGEKKLMNKFFDTMAKEPGKVEYGKDATLKVLKIGAVDTLLLSEELEDDVIDEFEKEANNMGTEVALISSDTREGSQLVDLGKIAGILRYAVE